jgi:uncharacterized protein with HEPN domain
MKDDRLYLEHIRQAIERIGVYAAGGRERFVRDTMVQDAIVRNCEIIGEAVKQLTEATKKRIPGVPWRSIAGFRDILIHNYMGVDLEEVWNVIEGSLPNLRRAVQSLLET